MCSDGERLYTFRAATLSALDVATGAIVWEVSVPVDLTAIDLRLESAGDVLLVAVEGTLLAYSTLDGSLRWQTAATEGSFVCLPAQVSPRSETSR